jgi:SAM-dependent methyltransferase
LSDAPERPAHRAPPEHPAAKGRWFEAIARHTGAAYLRYSFTKGTDQEVGFLMEALGLRGGQRVLDVGCGPGRHARALADRGLNVVGLDIAADFLAAAGAGIWVRGDARSLPFPIASFDAAISLCQGGFGLLGGVGDGPAMAEMARVLRPGGRLALTAFSAYFALRHLEDSDTFDAAAGVNHELATVRDASGTEATFDLWNTCFTPRELRLMAGRSGLAVDGLYAVEPGRYSTAPPDLDHPEWLLVATREAIGTVTGGV